MDEALLVAGIDRALAFALPLQLPLLQVRVTGTGDCWSWRLVSCRLRPLAAVSTSAPLLLTTAAAAATTLELGFPVPSGRAILPGSRPASDSSCCC